MKTYNCEITNISNTYSEPFKLILYSNVFAALIDDIHSCKVIVSVSNAFVKIRTDFTVYTYRYWESNKNET